MRWVPQPGAPGVATGGIAIGTVAMSRSTTIIITIRTIISTATSAARGRVIGSTIRNTAAMHPMGTGKQRTSLAVRACLELVIDPAPAEPVDRVGLVELAVRVARVGLATPVGLAVPEPGQVTAELEHDQVVARELALAVAELERVPLAVPPKTKSVTAPHRRGLVPVPKRVKDLAAAAEIMHALAAAEVIKAWAVAMLH